MMDEEFLEKFWRCHAKLDEDPAARAGFMTADGRHYAIASEGSQTFRGFEGRKFLVTLEGGHTIHTSNLWIQGEVPMKFRHLFKIRGEVKEVV